MTHETLLAARSAPQLELDRLEADALLAAAALPFTRGAARRARALDPRLTLADLRAASLASRKGRLR